MILQISPMDSMFKFFEKVHKELSEKVHFYPPLMYRF